MGNLDKIINFNIALNPCSTHCGAIDCSIGTYFHVVINLHNANLWNLGIVLAGDAKPKPSAPTTTPECKITRLPMMHE